MASRYTEQAATVSEAETGNGSSSGCGALDVEASATSPLLHASGRSPLATLTGVQILATGAYVPETVIRNEDLAELGYDKEWILQRTGIRERRRAAPDQASVTPRSAPRLEDTASGSRGQLAR